MNLVARCLTSGEGRRQDGESVNLLVGTLKATDGGACVHEAETGQLIAHTLRAEGFDASEDGTGRGTPIIPIDMRQASRGGRLTNNRPGGSSGGAPGIGIGEPGDPSFTVCDSHTPAIAFQPRIARNGRGQPKDTVDALVGSDSGVHGDSKPHVAGGSGVRRLTPRECERLQGFPDDWTRYGADGQELSDSARYRMLGNAVSVPVVAWIARRITEADHAR